MDVPHAKRYQTKGNRITKISDEISRNSKGTAKYDVFLSKEEFTLDNSLTFSIKIVKDLTKKQSQEIFDSLLKEPKTPPQIPKSQPPNQLNSSPPRPPQFGSSGIYPPRTPFVVDRGFIEIPMNSMNEKDNNICFGIKTGNG